MPGTKIARVIDWHSVERQYRAGIKPLRQIASEHGITHGAVNKRAKASGWTRDLQAKILAKAQDKVSKSLVSTPGALDTEVREREVIEANAEVLANAIRSQRGDLTRARAMWSNLAGEFEKTNANLELLEKLADIIAEESPKRMEVFLKAISLPSRVQSFSTMMISLRTLVELERKVLRLDDTAGPGDPIEQMSREELESAFRGILDRAKVIDGEVLHVVS